MIFVVRWYCNNCNLYLESGVGRRESTCPECGQNMQVKCIDKNSLPAIKHENCGWNALIKENPRYSYAMAASPEEIPERLKEYPDRVYQTHDANTGEALDACPLLIRNRTHKLQEMKRHRLHEL